MFKNLNKQRGYSNELYCAAKFTEAGYQISLPYQQTAFYDLIVDDGKELNRTQIKVAREACPTAKRLQHIEFKMKLIHRGGKYKKGQVDSFSTIYKGHLYMFNYRGKNPPRTLSVKREELGKYLVI